MPKTARFPVHFLVSPSKAVTLRARAGEPGKVQIDVDPLATTTPETLRDLGRWIEETASRMIPQKPKPEA
ncbi:MAG: hypothetical protein NXI12_03795 [Alphaproteobacteria bacterium]|nr:hypothetical protein [Alphaproteobacteria bacterium]